MSWIKSWSKLSFLLMTKVFLVFIKNGFYVKSEMSFVRKKLAKKPYVFPSKIYVKIDDVQTFLCEIVFQTQKRNWHVISNESETVLYDLFWSNALHQLWHRNILFTFSRNLTRNFAAFVNRKFVFCCMFILCRVIYQWSPYHSTGSGINH